MNEKLAKNLIEYQGKPWPDPNKPDELRWVHGQLQKEGLIQGGWQNTTNNIHDLLKELYINPNTSHVVKKIKDRWRARVFKKRSNKKQLNLSITTESYNEIERISTQERITASQLIEELLILRNDFKSKVNEAITDEMEGLKEQKQKLKKQRNKLKAKIEEKNQEIYKTKFSSLFLSGQPHDKSALQSKLNKAKKGLEEVNSKVMSAIEEFERDFLNT